MKELRIDSEIKKLIPPLTTEEYKQLEENIIAEGCRDALVVWGDTIIDGHNRYEICRKNEIDIETIEKEFKELDEAKVWIINNQKGRRNLTDGWKWELAQEKKRLLAEKGWEKQKETLGGYKYDPSVLSPSDKTESHDTRKEIAEELGWSSGKVAQADYVWKHGDEEVKGKVKSGEETVKSAYRAVKKEQHRRVPAEWEGTIVPANITLLEGDIFDQIGSVKDATIDCLLTDPPYMVMTDYEWDKQDSDFLDKWLALVKPKLKERYTGFIFCDARLVFEFEQAIRKHFTIKNRIIWIRKNMSMGRVVKDRFISSYEVVFYFGSKELNLPKNWGAERFDSAEFAVPQSNFKEGKYHPTQKPLELIKRLASIGSFEGDTILDPFAGSGTTGLAIKEIGGRKCILIERESEHCKTIKRRVSGA